MANTADVIIIGGGIIGNAIAYYLAKKGTDVIVLEGSDHIGMVARQEMAEVSASQDETRESFLLLCME